MDAEHKNSKPSTWKSQVTLSNLFMVLLVIALIVPTTRQYLQIGVSKVRMTLFSPDATPQEDRVRLESFDYRVQESEGILKQIPIGQGRVTFISYWATWCPPCVAEMGSMQALYNDYGTKVDFVLLSTESTETLNAFALNNGYTMPFYKSVVEPPLELKTSSIPTNYILDKNAGIVVKETGASDWNTDSVKALLDSLIKE